MSENGFEIFLFGKQTKNVSYKGDVKLFPTPESKIRLIFFVIKQSLELLINSPGKYFQISKIIFSRSPEIKNYILKAGLIFPILNNEPDIFHIQWAKTVERNPELMEILSCKLALSLRGAHINYSPLNDKVLAESYRKYFPLIDGFHAVSEAIAKESLRYGTVKEKIQVIHSSVSDDLLKENSELCEVGNEIEIISIGRYHWKKGYHYALDAMKILKEERIKFKYTIMAQGEIPEEILFIIDDYKFGDEVKIIKGMPHKELVNFLKTKDILLLPSVEEGIANVVLEAMAVGVPVLTTDCGGMNEVVKENINGYIIPVRDPKSIVSKIKEYTLTDIYKKKEIVNNAKNFIHEEFSREKQIADFRKFYFSLIK